MKRDNDLPDIIHLGEKEEGLPATLKFAIENLENPDSSVVSGVNLDNYKVEYNEERETYIPRLLKKHGFVDSISEVPNKLNGKLEEICGVGLIHSIVFKNKRIYISRGSSVS
jgi:hypothetical protein